MNHPLPLRRAAASLACALALPALAEGGTVTGKVGATPAKYLPETVVYLKAVAGTYAPRKHTMDQRGMQFLPHVLPITQGDTVEFLNNDHVAHNVYSPDGEGYNLGTFKQNENASYTFKKTGVYSQLCSIHPEMLAYVFVGQNPYAAAVDSGGRYAIKGVPPGTYQLAVWNAKLKAADRPVTVTAGKSTQVDLSIQR
ncbi:MAG TPA: carboxypeptidase regulatory-like domain-containing protein [Anaeromyxobacter sp.]